MINRSEFCNSESSGAKTAIEGLKDLVGKELKDVDNMILTIAEAKNSELVPEITCYLHESGGKRLRPMLALAFSHFTDTSKQNAVYLAASVELIHAATLLHDDVVDESSTRRGIATANNVWGNKIAILVGDYLFSHSFVLMVKTNSIRALELLSSTSSTIAEAEVRQIELVNKLDISIEAYVDLICSKTAVLFAAACMCGVIDEVESIRNGAYNYGLNLGIGYQIIDDTLDYFASDARFGKNLCGDLREKKVTLPLILLLHDAPDLQPKLEEILNKEEILQADADSILSYLNQYNIANKCKKFALGYLKIASENLNVMPKEKIQLCKLLRLLLDSLNNRSF